jgi:hypothetical protein
LHTGRKFFPNKTALFQWHGLCMSSFALPAGRTLGARLAAHKPNKQKTNCEERSMKLKQILTVCGVAAALCLTVASLQAQDNNGGAGAGQGGGQGGARRRGQGGGGPGGGGGNFDPAQMQQRMMDRYREELGFTNDTDWAAVEPLVQKVSDARREAGGGGMGRMFGRNRGGQGGGQGGPGGGMRGMFGTPSPEEEALQKAIDDNAPSGQIKDALAKYKSVQKEKQSKLHAAQAELKKVLSVKQEAQATLLGLVE